MVLSTYAFDEDEVKAGKRHTDSGFMAPGLMQIAPKMYVYTEGPLTETPYCVERRIVREQTDEKDDCDVDSTGR